MAKPTGDQTSVYLAPGLRPRVIEQAQRENKSMSQFISELLERALKRIEQRREAEGR